MDCVSEALKNGYRFRVLIVVDRFSCENLALVAVTSLSCHRVARDLNKAIAKRGMLKTIIFDTSIDWYYIVIREVSVVSCELNALINVI